MAETKRKELTAMWEKNLKEYEGSIRDLLRDAGQKGGYEKYAQLVLRQIKEKLLECTPQSIMLSILDCASLGLYPDPVLGHAYFVPYKNKKGVLECKLMPGYKGYIHLMMKNGVETVDARIVYSSDFFEYSLGTNAYIKHVPNPKLNESRGELIGAYAIMKIRGVEQPKFEVMSLADIKRAQAESKYGTAEDSPWVKWFDAMCKKTVIKNLARYANLSPDVDRLISVDEANDYDIKIVRPYSPKIESNMDDIEGFPSIIKLRRGLEVIPMGESDVSFEEVTKSIQGIKAQWIASKKIDDNEKEYGLSVIDEYSKKADEAYAKV